MTLLSLQNFSVTRRGRTILRDVNLTVGRGELVGIVGRNGAGQTALMPAGPGLHGFRGPSSPAPPPAPAPACTP